MVPCTAEWCSSALCGPSALLLSSLKLSESRFQRQRLWSGLEEGKPSTFCLSSKEIKLLQEAFRGLGEAGREVELHVTSCLMHLGHASSHLHEVGKLCGSCSLLCQRSFGPRRVASEARSIWEACPIELAFNIVSGACRWQVSCRFATDSCSNSAHAMLETEETRLGVAFRPCNSEARKAIGS